MLIPMSKGSRFMALLPLTLLIACGGSSPTQPQPSVTGPSSISGVISSPGSIDANTAGQAVGQQLSLRVGDSWWADKAAVQRKEAAGELPSGTVPGEYLVRLRPSVGAQSLTTLSVAGTTLTRVRPLGLPGLALYRTSVSAQGVQAQSGASILTALAARPEVLSAEPNRWLHMLKTPNDEYLPYQWNIQAMNLPAAWDTTTGTGVVVGVIDTGIVKHPDLAGKLLPGRDFVDNDSDPTDEGGDTEYHGSHVAGIIAAATNNQQGVAGVSWGAKIVPVRVLGTDGSGTTANIIDGAMWAAGLKLDGVPTNPNPAKVINLSLGGTGTCSQAEQQLFDALDKAGVVTVVAAGNEDTEASTSSPANCTKVITVGATGPDGKRAFYSNYGSRIDVMAPGGNSNLVLNVGADQVPGGVLSTVYNDSDGSFDYAFYQGTSQAAPHVAGAAALLLGVQPKLTPAQVLSRLKAAARPISDADCGNVKAGCGAGLIDAQAALLNTAPTLTPPAQPVASVKTFVAALYLLPGGTDIDPDQSLGVLIDQKTLQNSYRLDKAGPGEYKVVAWQDINGDSKVDDKEPFGVYPSNVKVDATARSISGIDITLQPYSAVNSAAGASAISPSALRAAVQQVGSAK